MGRPLAITKRQAKSLIEAAREAGGFAEVNPTTGVIRLFPTVPPDVAAEKPEPVDDKPRGYL